MASESLAVKYRPKTWNDVVEQQTIKQILNEQIKTDQVKRVLLFTGPAGCGKTTNARIFARELEPCVSNIVELNCADKNGVDDIRGIIIDNAKVRPLQGKYKIFILDECFYSGSLISTETGYKPIEDIKKGDKVYTMEGLNRVSNVLVHNVPLNRLVLLTVSGKKIITTKDHLFFTSNGWVEAQNLVYGDILYGDNTVKENCKNLSKLSKTVFNISECTKVLFKNMLYSISRKAKNYQQKKSQIPTMRDMWKNYNFADHIDVKNLFETMHASINKSDGKNLHEDRVWSERSNEQFQFNEDKKSNVSTRKYSKNDEYTRKKWNFTPMEWHKGRKRFLHKRATPVEATITPVLDLGISSKNRAAEKEVSMAYLLQVRPRLSRNKIGDRGGWQSSQIEKEYIKRCQKNALLGALRVESVEVFESANKSKFKQCGVSDKELQSGVVKMYDLQINDCPNYFVNNCLVHNCHMLTAQAQNALLKLLEEPPAYCIFTLCTTDPQKVLTTILSRAYRYDFQKISMSGIISRLNYILECEKNTGADIQGWTPDAINYIARQSNGGMRDAITLLDKCLSYTKNLTVDDVVSVLGVTNYDIQFEVLDSLLQKNESVLLQKIAQLYESGKDLKLFVKNFLTFVLDVNKFIILQNTESINIPNSYEQKLRMYNQSHRLYLKELLSKLVKLDADMRWETNPKTLLESTLLLEVI